MKSADQLPNHVNALEAPRLPGFHRSPAAAGSSSRLITLSSTAQILCGDQADLYAVIGR